MTHETFILKQQYRLMRFLLVFLLLAYAYANAQILEVFTLITAGSMELKPGEMQELSFQINPGQHIESLDEHVPTSDVNCLY